MRQQKRSIARLRHREDVGGLLSPRFKKGVGRMGVKQSISVLEQTLGRKRGFLVAFRHTDHVDSAN